MAAHLVTPRRVVPAVVLVLLANAFLLWGDRARPVSVAEAVESFRHGEFSTAPPLPAPGVYVYDTTGFEAVNRLSIRREYPRETVRIVRAKGGGCGWEERVEIFEEHVETYDVCTENDVRDTGFATGLSYYYVTSGMSLDCGHGGTRTGAGMTEGETATYECSGDGVRATVTVTYEGADVVPVEGLDAPCRRVRVVTALSGSTTGVASRGLCTDERTGLVLREERAVSVSTRSGFVGRVTYTERATFALRSLVPER